jgi:site-specific DNA recombinase
MPEIADKDRKCALYLRVSTPNQAEEGESLDEQEERLRNFCKFKGWKDFRVYREEGSGR